MKALSQDAIALVDMGQRDAAIEKYGELEIFVNGRVIQDKEIRALCERARELVLPLRREAEVARLAAELSVRQAEAKRKETETIDQVKTLQQVAQSLELSGELEAAKTKFDEALEVAELGKTDHPEFVRMIESLSGAKNLVSAQIAEREREAERMRQLAAKEAELAKLRATISGGAWVTRKSGSSDPLRGLNVYVVRQYIPNAEAVAFLEIVVAAANERLQDARNSLADTEVQARQHPDIYASSLELDKEMVKLREQMLESRSRLLGETKSSKSPSLTDLLPLSVYCREESSRTQDQWSRLVARHLVAQAHADIDGKYKVEVPGGSFCVVAELDTQFSRIMWCVPMQVDTEKNHPLDLRNDNAVFIENKD